VTRYVFQLILLATFVACFSSVSFAKQEEQKSWSLVIYAANDEKDLDMHSGAIVDSLLNLPLPKNVQLLIENDTFIKPAATRYIRNWKRTEKISLPELDSASPEVFADFLDWAKAESVGTHTILIIMTHSWGWKGIIQDYTLPDRPDEDTMMPLYRFSEAVVESSLNPDLVFLDSCVLGTAESIHELRDLSRYLIVSQRETPYSGYPFEELFALLATETARPVDVARFIPGSYVRAYSQNGKLAGKEGEFDVVTVASINTDRWSKFADKFSQFVATVEAVGFRKKLIDLAKWSKAFVDGDWDIDLVELLFRLPAFADSEEVFSSAQILLDEIGYPEAVAMESAEAWEFRSDEVEEFELRFKADRYMLRNYSPKKVLAKLKKRWVENNQEFRSKHRKLNFTVRNREFVVSGLVPKTGIFVRPWLPGVLEVKLSVKDSSNVWKKTRYMREKDYFSVTKFPTTSFLVAEAHTQGAPFIHGVGINLKPLMNKKEERAVDLIRGLKGSDLYRANSWNKKTGWADLILFK